MSGIRVVFAKNVALLVSDPKALALTFLLPIAIALLSGFAFSGMEGGEGKGTARKTGLLVIDADGTPETARLVARLRASGALAIEVPEGGLDAARERLRLGQDAAALVIPKGTGERLKAGLFGAGFSGGPPTLTLLVDPSKSAETGMLQGVLFREVMGMLAGDAFPDAGGMPEPVRFVVEAVAAPAAEGSPFEGYDGFAHAFAGMGVMFLLFGVLEGGCLLIRERQRGTLARIVASPTPAWTVLAGEACYLVALGVLQLSVMLAVAHVFGVRVRGSWLGLAAVVVAGSAAAAGFGLLIAALFRTEKTAQPVAILVILVTSALGGSWWPLFITPKAMQDAASLTLTKWAVGGLEGALWRGWGLGDILWPHAAILAGMAVVLGAIAWWRFRFE